MKIEDQILKSLQLEFKRRINEEGLHRIAKCLSMLTEQEVWLRPNVNTVSIGNLVMHLSGNVRQWICAGLGGQKDIRTRDLEFSTESGINKEELMERIAQTISAANKVVDEMTAADLNKKFDVQVYKENGLSIIVHVVEHFSYHVGQITYAVKSLKNIDTQYYPEDLG